MQPWRNREWVRRLAVFDLRCRSGRSVEGLNNKIRVFQRRAYGLRDQEYLRLKVLTCTLDPL